MTISRICKNESVGKPCGMSFMLSWMKALMDSMPMLVSMLVYIEVASAVNSLASFGSVNPFMSWMTVAEFFR